MQKELAYNIQTTEFNSDQPVKLYKSRKDSIFAGVFSKNGSYFLIRDHFGIVPLYYWFEKNELKFSFNLSEWTGPIKNYNNDGLKCFLGIGTSKLIPPFEGLYLVPPGAVLKITEKKIETIFTYKYLETEDLSKTSTQDLVQELDKRLKNATERQLKSDKVGLYLSGGIDSGLTGHYLRELGAYVTGYTCAPWGKSSSDLHFSKINASVAANNHEISILEKENIVEAVVFSNSLFKVPCGTTAEAPVANIWQKLKIDNENQVFGAQGTDTLTCSVSQQYKIFFLFHLPKILKRKIHRSFSENDYIDAYLNLCSRGHIDGELRERIFDRNIKNRFRGLIEAGLLVAHTPSDGEVLSQPCINKQKSFGNIFYDVDVISFLWSLKWYQSLSLSNEVPFLSIDKKIIRTLSKKYLPSELVNRKKGFTAPIIQNQEILKKISAGMSVSNQIPGLDKIKLDLIDKYRIYKLLLFSNPNF